MEVKQHEIILVPLGGAETVGASCYFIRFEGKNIIFDAGIGFAGKLWFYPAFDELLQMGVLESMSQIDQIYISHGHLDHCGGIFELMKICPNAKVFMTYPTRSFIEQQLRKNPRIFGLRNNTESVLAAQSMLSRFEILSFLQTRNMGSFKMTLFPAGHIPGAAMFYLESDWRSFLYTGDYSIDKTPLTSGCLIPEDIHPEIMLICALRARQPYASVSTRRVNEYLYRIEKELEKGNSVSCRCAQLTKGVEFLKILSQSQLKDVPVIIDVTLFDSIQGIEHAGIPLLKPNHLMPDSLRRVSEHIYLNDDGILLDASEVPLDIQFTLHETYQDMCSLIEKLNARQVILVHVGRESGEGDVKESVLRNSDCQSSIWYASKGLLYYL